MRIPAEVVAVSPTGRSARIRRSNGRYYLRNRAYLAKDPSYEREAAAVVTGPGNDSDGKKVVSVLKKNTEPNPTRPPRRKAKFKARFNETVEVATFETKRVAKTNPETGEVKRARVSAKPAAEFEKGVPMAVEGAAKDTRGWRMPNSEHPAYVVPDELHQDDPPEPEVEKEDPMDYEAEEWLGQQIPQAADKGVVQPQASTSGIHTQPNTAHLQRGARKRSPKGEQRKPNKAGTRGRKKKPVPAQPAARADDEDDVPPQDTNNSQRVAVDDPGDPGGTGSPHPGHHVASPRRHTTGRQQPRTGGEYHQLRQVTQPVPRFNHRTDNNSNVPRSGSNWVDPASAAMDALEEQQKDTTPGQSTGQPRWGSRRSRWGRAGPRLGGTPTPNATEDARNGASRGLLPPTPRLAPQTTARDYGCSRPRSSTIQDDRRRTQEAETRRLDHLPRGRRNHPPKKGGL